MRRWTAAEIEAVKAFYPYCDESWHGWSEVLPDRSFRSIKSKANSLGITMENRKRRQSKYELVQEIKNLTAKGLSFPKIDKLLSLPDGSAKNILMIGWYK